MSLTYASVCDGIGAVHCAWMGMGHPLGWRCAWTSEIEPYPAAVVEHHWKLPNLGDMTTIDTTKAIDEHGPIDLLVGGTPCQSFSVAGLRGGMDDPRGNLALVYLGLADALRPRWVVWENVPGVLSSASGELPSCPPDRMGVGPGERVVVEDQYDETLDLGCFLAALSKLGYGWAYRVLDAQYIRVDTHPRAVPQRRRRVFVVGCLGGWQRAGGVLFEREGLSGHPAPRRKAGSGAVRTLGASTGGCSAKEQQHTFVGPGGEPLNPLDVQGVAGALSPGAHPGGYNGQDAYSGHLIPHKPELAIQERASGVSSGPGGKGWRDDGSAYTLEARGCPQSVLAFDPTQITHQDNRSNPQPGDPCHTIGKGTKTPVVAFGITPSSGQGSELRARELDAAPSLNSTDEARATDRGTRVVQSMAVRRLMPLECERLQGFPDHYTAIDFDGKPASDTRRYQALGNSMPVNVMRWIGQRIAMVEEVES